jgi:hypothetical protein
VAEEPDDLFKAVIVNMILDSKPETALEALSKRYRVDTPRLGVGVFKRHSKGVRAVYSPERREILAAKREFLYDPFVILHEFYHHIRSVGGKHRGTEKNADRFAIEYIRAFYRVATRLSDAKPD